MSGVICKRRIAARVNGKVSKKAARPAMMCGFKMAVITKEQEEEVKVAELKRLRKVKILIGSDLDIQD